MGWEDALAARVEAAEELAWAEPRAVARREGGKEGGGKVVESA